MEYYYMSNETRNKTNNMQEQASEQTNERAKKKQRPAGSTVMICWFKRNETTDATPLFGIDEIKFSTEQMFQFFSRCPGTLHTTKSILKTEYILLHLIYERKGAQTHVHPYIRNVEHEHERERKKRHCNY